MGVLLVLKHSVCECGDMWTQ